MIPVSALASSAPANGPNGGRIGASQCHRLRTPADTPTTPVTATATVPTPMAIGLRYVHSSDGVRSVSLLPERKRQFAKPPLHPVYFDVRKVLTVHARCALVGAALSIGMSQDVFAADLVVQGVEAIAGFCLRFRVQRRLQFLNALRS